MDGATDIKAFPPNLSLVERSILPVAEKRKEKTRRYHAADILCRGTHNLLGRAMT